MDPVLVASPFLKDSHEFQQQQPSSASSSTHFNTSHPDSPYEGFTFEQDFTQENHHFPHTPSYNGSYQNSPYSVASDLPAFDNPDALDFSSFDNRSAQVGEEYDPSDFDIPNGPSLLTFDDSFMPGVDPVSVAITPPFDQPSPNGYDHSSPASSAGEDGRRSRASSTSSYLHPNSPPMDFASSFENGLHFDSPAWPASGLPNDRPSPPAQKPQSPPQLVIPESPSMAANEEPPTINAPEGDGMPGGPQLHIVPATPISGGGGVAQNVPFLQQAMKDPPVAMTVNPSLGLEKRVAG
ncbi:hypothetical protein EIP86_000555 [Pleurotus ostreatoroseus]|nr:hypothetical protein EIP86_000555 [Pleurotus ostreatoroseus]